MQLPSDLGFIRAQSATERLQDLHSAGCCLRFSPLTVLLSSGLASPPGASHGNKPHSASYWLSMSFAGSDRWQSITRWAEGKKSVVTFKCRALFFYLDLSLKAENGQISSAEFFARLEDKQTAPAQPSPPTQSFPSPPVLLLAHKHTSHSSPVNFVSMVTVFWWAPRGTPAGTGSSHSCKDYIVGSRGGRWPGSKT